MIPELDNYSLHVTIAIKCQFVTLHNVKKYLNIFSNFFNIDSTDFKNIQNVH